MKVHAALGPGLLESVCEKCLKHELVKRGWRVESQVWVPAIYDGIEIEGGYKIDLLVEDCVIVELKVVEQILDVHKAQLLSYLKLANKEVGLLINFNVVHLKHGIEDWSIIINARVLCVRRGFGLTTVPSAGAQSISGAGSHPTPTTSAASLRVYSSRSFL
jgi:GxxExxY protein